MVKKWQKEKCSGKKKKKEEKVEKTMKIRIGEHVFLEKLLC